MSQCTWYSWILEQSIVYVTPTYFIKPKILFMLFVFCICITVCIIITMYNLSYNCSSLSIHFTIKCLVPLKYNTTCYTQTQCQNQAIRIYQHQFNHVIYNWEGIFEHKMNKFGAKILIPVLSIWLLYHSDQEDLHPPLYTMCIVCVD